MPISQRTSATEIGNGVLTLPKRVEPKLQTNNQLVPLSIQCALAINDRLRSTTACDQRPLAINDRLRSTTACVQRPLAINDRLRSTTASDQRPLAINDRLRTATVLQDQ